MSTIFFCGDVHGDFQYVIEAIQAHEPDAIILLGDLQLRAPLEVELSSIPGCQNCCRIQFFDG